MNAIFAHTFPYACARGGVFSHVSVEPELLVFRVTGLVIAIGRPFQILKGSTAAIPNL